MSREFHLLTRERPSQDSLLDALREAMAEITPPEVDGDFENQNAYLNVSSPDLWIEIEPPGHVEAVVRPWSGEATLRPSPARLGEPTYSRLPISYRQAELLQLFAAS